MYRPQLNGKGRMAPTRIDRDPGAPAKALQDKHALSLRNLLQLIWRRLWVVVLVGILLVGAVAGFDLLRTPIYQASIKVLVGQEQKENASSTLGSDVQGLQQLTRTVTEVVNTRTVADAVIQRLDLQITPESFLKNMSVQQASGTQVIDVSYRDPDPERARLVVATIGETFSEQVSDVSPNANAITATVWEEAVVPDSPVSPNPLRDGLLALVLGSMLGVGLAFLLEQLDDRWRSPEEVEHISGVPNFGVVRQFKAAKSKKESD